MKLCTGKRMPVHEAHTSLCWNIAQHDATLGTPLPAVSSPCVCPNVPFAGRILAWFNGTFLTRLHTDGGANPTRNMSRWVITQMQQEVMPLQWDYSRAGLSALARIQQWIRSVTFISLERWQCSHVPVMLGLQEAGLCLIKLCLRVDAWGIEVGTQGCTEALGWEATCKDEDFLSEKAEETCCCDAMV